MTTGRIRAWWHDLMTADRWHRDLRRGVLRAYRDPRYWFEVVLLRYQTAMYRPRLRIKGEG